MALAMLQVVSELLDCCHRQTAYLLNALVISPFVADRRTPSTCSTSQQCTGFEPIANANADPAAHRHEPPNPEQLQYRWASCSCAAATAVSLAEAALL